MGWRERRAENRAQRQANRGQRQQNRSDHREDRIDARVEQQALRQEGRTQRQGVRQATKQVAYENGIDPNAWIADSIGHAGDAVGDVFGKGSAKTKLPSEGDNMMLVAGAVLLFMMMKK